MHGIGRGFPKIRIQAIIAIVNWPFAFICLHVFLANFAVTQSAHAQSVPVMAGYRDFYFGTGSTSEPTSEKPQSKLWWNDGFWWGILWNPWSNRYEIHRFDLATQSWITRRTAVDSRSSSRADVLWDGQRLYVVSHIFTTNPGPTSPSTAGRLYRYSYDFSSKLYSLDAGFPVNVNGSKSEILVLDKDSTGKLWVTWVENGKVMVNRTTGDDLTWGAPLVLPVQGSDVDPDDISTLVAFGSKALTGGNKIGILWSNQKDSTTYFAVHLDGGADEVWQPREEALSGLNLGAVSEDHINLKASCDGSGNIYAAALTNLSGKAPGIFVLKRSPAGVWTRHVFATADLDHSRPMLLINEENQRLYVFARSNDTGPGIIYMKSASLNDLEFPEGLGTPFIASSTDVNINNPTSTKQCVNNSSGILVLAGDKDSRYYLHNYVDLIDGVPKITSLVPDRGPIGAEVTINGSNFTSTTRVAFNGTPVSSFTVDSDTQLRANVPVGVPPGRNKISVLTSIDVVLSATDFTVTAPPMISAFTPADGPVGTEVKILGINFTGAIGVAFNGIPPGGTTSFTVDADTLLRANVPAAATTGHISVTNADGTGSSSTVFTVTAVPTVSSFSPARAQAGTEVTITGNSFTGATVVSFNGTATRFTLDSDTQLRATVPARAKTGRIGITNSAGTGFSASYFTIQNALAVDTEGSGGVELNPPGGVYDQGTVVTLTAIPDLGWEFGDWDRDLDGSTNPHAIVVDSDKKVTAVFLGLEEFTLTVETVGSGSVALDPPGGIYYSGTVVTLTPIPASGFAFSGWRGDLSGWPSPDRITMKSDTSVTAIFTPIPERRFAAGIWTSAEELRGLPISGASWENLKAEADTPTGTPNLSDQNDSVNVRVLAKALVYARTGEAKYRNEVIDACMAARGTERGGRTLALGRELAAYVVAADLVGLPLEKDAIFRAWLREVLTEELDGRTLQSTHEDRPNNWGTHCGASRAAVAAYLGDAAELARIALVFKGWLGDRSAYADFRYGALDWQADPNAPVGINPQGATINGHSVDGVLPDDQRRSGGFAWPPPKESYVYGALQGALVQAVILYRAGYEVWNWENKALLRAFKWLYEQANYPADSHERWQIYIINHYYQTNFPTPFPVRPGKNMAWTDWLYGPYFSLPVEIVGSGTVTALPAEGVYAVGTEVKLTAVPSANWVFSGWGGDLSGSSNPATITIDGNVSVTATFTPVGSEGVVMHEESRSGGSTNSTTVRTSASLAGADGHLYLAAISTRRKVRVTAVSGLGLSWKLVRARCSGRNKTGVEVWMAQGTPDGDGMVTATLSAAPDNAVIAVSRYSGVPQGGINPIGKIISGNSNGINGSCSGGVDSSSYSFNLATTVNGAMVYGAVAMRNKNHVPGAGFAERAEIKQGSSSSMASVAVADMRVASAPQGGVAVTGSFSGNVDWAVVAVEIKPQAATTKQLAMSEAEQMAEDSPIPSAYQLDQNYPNPFNAHTAIGYALPQETRVRLVIYNPMGQLVRQLVNKIQPAGYKRVRWDGRDDQGQEVGSGVYLVRLDADLQRFTKKITLMK